MALTPFVPEREAAVTSALKSLLGVPDHLDLRWRDEPLGNGWALVVTIAAASGPVELELCDPGLDRPMYFRGTRVGLGHRQLPEDAEPLWRVLSRRVAALDGSTCNQIDQLHAARAEWLPYRDVDDDAMRTFSGGEALLRLGFRCNQDCSFCWQDRLAPGPPLAVLEGWLDEMVAAGANTIVLSGGEPTVYLDTLLALARRATGHHGLPVLLQTNAIRLAQPHVLEALLAAGVSGLLASYHSADATVSDALTLAPGTHARTEAGIRAALQAGLAVDLNAVVERRTLPGLVARSEHIVAAFGPVARDRGKLTVGFAYPTDYFDSAVYRDQVVALDEVAAPLTQAIALLRQADIPVGPVGSCGFPLCVLRDTPEAIDLSDLDDLAPEHTRCRSHPEPCQSCALRGVCIGPRREYLDSHGTRGLVPFAEVPPGLVAALAVRDTARV